MNITNCKVCGAELRECSELCRDRLVALLEAAWRVIRVADITRHVTHGSMDDLKEATEAFQE